MRLVEYVDAAGRSPFADWFDRLDDLAAAKVSVGLQRIVLGMTSNVKAVGEGVAEYKIDWGPGYRLYFGMDGPALVVLLAGGTKVRQQRDIAAAKVLWADYKARKKDKA